MTIRRIGLVALLAAWLATYLPWVAATGAALSSNLYDLAEWMSLSPFVRGANPPLLGPFLLRAVPGLIAVILAGQGRAAKGVARWSLILLGLLIALGLMPPFDFFRGQFSDPNYRQQMTLALLSGIGVVLAAWRTSGWLEMALIVLSMLCTLVGAILGLNNWAALHVRVGPGVGIGITFAALFVALIAAVIATRRKPYYDRSQMANVTQKR